MKTLISAGIAFALAGAAHADHHMQSKYFNRIASIPTTVNLPAGKDPLTTTSPEIIAATADGNMVVYSDSPLGGLGMIDITDPHAPKGAGFMNLDGEPTSVTIHGRTALVGVNTSESYTKPSGFLAQIDLDSRAVTQRCALKGQPDAVAISPNGHYLAIAIENERDEDLNDGEIPQLPAGHVELFKLNNGAVDCASQRIVALTGLAEIAPTDPEPEFVAINAANEVVVTMQENNHLVVLSAESGKVIAHFSAGKVDLRHVDTEEEGALTFDGKLDSVPREPDAAKWLDNDRFVIANEGDYNGGSRGFTIFRKDGAVLYESGLDFEYRVAMLGHYPEKRSGNKGAEPEGLEVGSFGGKTFIFIMSERGSVIGVYQDNGDHPTHLQTLPSGIGPESAVAIPSRNLLVSANEEDLGEDGGVRAHVMIYQYGADKPAYPQIESVMKDGRPLGWGALSGLTADPTTPGMLYAVNDSFYGMQPTIFKIDATQTPAKIVDAIRVTREGQAAQKLDLEGVAADGKGGFWLASEGRPDRLIPHAIYHVNSKGEIKKEIAFPDELMSVQTRYAAEGIAMIGDTLWIAIQRQWKDDPENTVKLLAYNTKEKSWGAVRYPTEAAETGWVGLSEITAYGDNVYIIERDNQIGEAARIKRLYKVPLSALKPAPLGGELPVVEKTLVRDFIPDLKALNGYVVDKIEGFAVDASGQGYAVTDNDGVDDSSGETYFFQAGKY